MFVVLLFTKDVFQGRRFNVEIVYTEEPVLAKLRAIAL